MPMEIKLKDVLLTQDGPYRCFDTVISAKEIAKLSKTGFLEFDAGPQGARRSLDRAKVQNWFNQLILGEAYFGQLCWNLRKGETVLNYDEENRSLTFDASGVTIPDSYHRHKAILKAVENVKHGTRFDQDRLFSLRIYNVSASEETKIFYAMNQEVRKADSTWSKWSNPEGVTKIARAFVEGSRHLRGNVDTAQDRISQRSSKLCVFITLSRAFEEHWFNRNPDNEASLQIDVNYLVGFWDKLVEVRRELGTLDIRNRQQVRDELLVDSALAISAYIAIAWRMYQQGIELTVLEKLGHEVNVNGKMINYFSRDNPLWKDIDVLVPWRSGLKVGNSRTSRQNMLEAISEQVEVNL